MDTLVLKFNLPKTFLTTKVLNYLLLIQKFHSFMVKKQVFWHILTLNHRNKVCIDFNQCIELS